MRATHNHPRHIMAGIVLFVLIILIFSGCTPANSIVGKWQTQVTVGSAPLTETYEFASDGTMTEKIEGSSLLTSCTYTVKGDTVTITPTKTTSFGKPVELPQKDMAQQVYSFKIYQDALTLSFGQSDVIFTRSHA